MHTPPLGLGTTTIAVHHGVGAQTFKMTPIYSIFLSSAWTLSLSGKGMLLGVYRANCFAPGFSFMVYYPFIEPKPLKRSRNWSGMFFTIVSSCIGMTCWSFCLVLFNWNVFLSFCHVDSDIGLISAPVSTLKEICVFAVVITTFQEMPYSLESPSPVFRKTMSGTKVSSGWSYSVVV